MCPWLFCSFLQMTSPLIKHILKSRNYGLKQNIIQPTHFSAPLKKRAVGNIVLRGNEHLVILCWQRIKRKINKRSIAWETTPPGAPTALFPRSNLTVFPMASPLEGSWRAGWLCSPGKDEMCCPYVYGEWYAYVWPWGCACVWGCVCMCICMGSMCTYRYICMRDGCVGGVCLLKKKMLYTWPVIWSNIKHLFLPLPLLQSLTLCS